MLFESDSELGTPSRRLTIAVFVILVAATLAAVVRDRPIGDGSYRRAAGAEVAAAEPEPAPVALAWIDAVPWGRIERIASASGETRGLPAAAETPVVLELPPGEWIVTISNPDSEETRECALSLTLERPDSCQVEFERLSVDEYFREAGWWR